MFRVSDVLNSILSMPDHGVLYATYLRHYFAAVIGFCLLANCLSLFRQSQKSNHPFPFNPVHVLKCVLLVYCLLLQTPHDFQVVVLLTLFANLVEPILVPSSLDAVPKIFLVCMLSRFSYFALGNSNSFTTVDIQSAYTGLTDHYFPIVALHLFLVMFSGPLVFYSQLWQVFAVCKEPKWLQCCAITLLLYRSCTLSFVFTCSWLQRFHIMTWTVFSPKVLFEIGWSIFDILFALSLIFTDLFKLRLN